MNRLKLWTCQAIPEERQVSQLFLADALKLPKAQA